MEIVTARSSSSGERPQQVRRRKASDGHVVAQLLDSPLPTPRRSCCGSAADTPRSVRGASAGASSPQRTYVPFSWESSPGVPKVAYGGNGMPLGRDVMPPPRPPPGRGHGTGIGMGTPWHYATRASYHGHTTTDATSSAGGDDDDTFSDALDRISSSDRLAALSARLSSIDGRGGASRRLSSFIMDRFLPAANAIATTSTEKKRAKKSPRRRRAAPRCSKHEDEAEAPAAAWRETHTLPSLRREQNYQDADHLTQHAWRLEEEEARGDDQTSPAPSPRACGFLVLFPWSVKPVVLCGFPRSPAPPRPVRTPRADAVASPPRRSTTLGDVLVKESRLRNGIGSGRMSHWYEEKSGSGKEWSSASAGSGLGMSILGTSKRYCADARKALSRLARSATDNGGSSPRIGRERRSGKPAASTLGSTSGRMPQLKPPSESWLSHARGSNAVNNRR
ncbi:hypothetical protein BRADI_2g22620v3 [Brachypodium distachyon]|uniref:Uncharacterized protein n=1 Tax=Brachypodium distachyon TaxID=15368 RepID=I1HIJ0_BRADI|nr:hypothetical protein BRADI_2g22620v3 [Brachypodium distachyon]